MPPRCTAARPLSLFFQPSAPDATASSDLPPHPPTAGAATPGDGPQPDPSRLFLACAVLRRRAESLLLADGAAPPVHAAVLAWADSEFDEALGEGAEMDGGTRVARVGALLCAAAAAGVVNSSDALRSLVRAPVDRYSRHRVRCFPCRLSPPLLPLTASLC